MQKSRSEAAEFRFKYGYEMPVDHLAQVLADQAQVYTQVRPAPPRTCAKHIEAQTLALCKSCAALVPERTMTIRCCLRHPRFHNGHLFERQDIT